MGEVTIGASMIVETCMTVRIVGCHHFCTSAWGVLDIGLGVLAAISLGYGLKHVGTGAEICESDVPLLLARFALQPLRVFFSLAGTYRIQQMQTELCELQVDFNV